MHRQFLLNEPFKEHRLSKTSTNSNNRYDKHILQTWLKSSLTVPDFVNCVFTNRDSNKLSTHKITSPNHSEKITISFHMKPNKKHSIFKWVDHKKYPKLVLFDTVILDDWWPPTKETSIRLSLEKDLVKSLFRRFYFLYFLRPPCSKGGGGNERFCSISRWPICCAGVETFQSRWRPSSSSIERTGFIPISRS